MTQQTGSGRKGFFRFHISAAACSTLLVLLCLLMVTSCSLFRPRQAPQPLVTIDLPKDVVRYVVPESAVLGVVRIDTDADNELEWLVFYRFDEVRPNGPVAGLIYDVVPRGAEFPEIYPYKLRLPNNDYLAVRQPDVRLVDIVSEAEGQARPELVFTTPTDAAFFRINPASTSRLSDNPSRYEAVGLFHSEHGVSFDPETYQVTVTRVNGYERSRLVIREIYRPGSVGYFMPGTGVLAPPFISKIDFPEGIPSGILDTPYPEKIVLAFYQTLIKQNPQPEASAYLSPAAAQLFAAGSLRYGSPFSLDQLRGVQVTKLAYQATNDNSTDTTAEVDVTFVSQAGERVAVPGIRWHLRRINQQWKIDSVGF